MDGYSAVEDQGRNACQKALTLAKEQGALTVFDVVPHHSYVHYSMKALETLSQGADIIIVEIRTLAHFLGFEPTIIPEKVIAAFKESFPNSLGILRYGDANIRRNRFVSRLIDVAHDSNKPSSELTSAGYGDRLTIKQVFALWQLPKKTWDSGNSFYLGIPTTVKGQLFILKTNEHISSKKDQSEHWEDVFKKQSSLPWDTDILPAEVKGWSDRFEEGRILDVGCGRGQHAIRIAGQGHSVVGIDISKTAIEQAMAAVAGRKLRIQLLCINAVEYASEEPFDLVIDYSVFHHIPFDDRQKYARMIIDCMKEGGIFVLVCYSDRDSIAQGKSSRLGAMGNVITHPTQEEIFELFDDQLQLLKAEKTSLGDKVPHNAHHIVYKKA